MSAVLKRQEDPEDIIERVHLVHDRRNIYTVGENWDFLWSLSELQAVEDGYQQDIPIDLIADSVGRSVMDVGLLVMDRAEQGRIRLRAGGAYGNAAPTQVDAEIERLTDGQKRAIVRLIQQGAKQTDLAEAVGIGYRALNQIYRRRADIRGDCGD